MAKAVGSIQIPKIIEAMQRAIAIGLIDIGEDAVKNLRTEVENKDLKVTERLHDSFGYATNKKVSALGPNALIDDAFEKPSTPNTLQFGNKAPYAASVNFGTTSGVQLGQNGNPDSEEGLYNEVLKWARIRYANGTLEADIRNESDLIEFANTVTKNLLAQGTDANPFWAQGIQETKGTASLQLITRLDLELAKIQPVTNIIEVK